MTLLVRSANPSYQTGFCRVPGVLPRAVGGPVLKAGLSLACPGFEQARPAEVTLSFTESSLLCEAPLTSLEVTRTTGFLLLAM